MKTIAALFVMAAGIVTVAAQQAPPVAIAPMPTFRATVQLTVVLVDVTDRDNHSIAGLKRGDFVLLEDGAPQPLVHFLSADGAVDVGLLIDISGSIVPVLPDLRRTATDFVDALRKGDRVTVVGFDQRVHPLCPLTDDRRELERAVTRVRPSGSTSLYDSVYISVKTLASSGDEFTRRKAIVVITDGEDTSSILQAEDVRDQARRYGMPIYLILLNQDPGGMRDRLGSFEDKKRDYEMKSIAADTGGRVFAVREGRSLKDTYRSIVGALSQQYVLTYEPTRPDRSPQITVQLPSRPAAVVKAHPGRDLARAGG